MTEATEAKPARPVDPAAIVEGKWFELSPGGLRACARFEADENPIAPWEYGDGHGPVRELRTRKEKHPGERIIEGRGGYLLAYDVAEAVKIARRDGWGCSHRGDLEHVSERERAACAVEGDFRFLRGYVREEWYYGGAVVQLAGPDGAVLGESACWQIESNAGDYWKEVAADLIEELASEADPEGKGRMRACKECGGQHWCKGTGGAK